MSNLEASYNFILNKLIEISGTENFYFKPVKPKLSDIELISLIILAEFKSIDSEYQLFREIKGWAIESKIERSVYNRRKRKLFPFLEEIRCKMVKKFNDLSNGDIIINQLSFVYKGTRNIVLHNIDLKVPKGETIAIVGASGSGKTTLVKLLLQYYNVKNGSIEVGGHNINDINTDLWRRKCGAVMQDGFIFSDTIAKNIAISEDEINLEKLEYASKMANLDEFVSKFPLKYDTMIGQEGRGLSQGQKQRILIARAIYKMPEYLFLDEATNALDADNEKEITERLNDFMKSRTVFIVAHRLSTVKNADKIIVLDNGEIIEQGTHNELVAARQSYYKLIKNQLELGT